jgi:hypothetical protein
VSAPLPSCRLNRCKGGRLPCPRPDVCQQQGSPFIAALCRVGSVLAIAIVCFIVYVLFDVIGRLL